MDLSLTLDSRDEATIVKEDGPDGFSAETIFKNATGCQGLTYDDVILMPGESRTERRRQAAPSASTCLHCSCWLMLMFCSFLPI